MDEPIKKLIIAGYSFVDYINQVTALMTYDFESGIATCHVCGGSSDPEKRARGWIDILHKLDCKFNGLQEALEPYNEVWEQYLIKRYGEHRDCPRGVS